MAAPANAPDHRTLHITVHRDDNNGHKHGTFVGPPPKMRVNSNDWMKWDLNVVPNDNSATFEVKFQGFSSPFGPANNPILSITNSNELQAIRDGLYHYAVKVTTASGEFRIDQCPEADVGG